MDPNVDAVEPRSIDLTPAPRLIVGIGASAGGVGALRELFAHAAPGAGIA